MARTLIIENDCYNWDISESGEPPEHEGGDEPLGNYGIWRTNKERILYLFSCDVSNAQIEESKMDSRFLEVCEFTHPQSGVRFTGTWIDALKFIQKTLTEAQKRGHY
ncbi:hypothetical protein [Wolinella succinogenes]|uniref:hypothetical protein n=1 Tax=Wolinella succinogenes TaxID=844 RepID=UPI002408F873|nr:hypothetical protein [Wolinella succinogenes]